MARVSPPDPGATITFRLDPSTGRLVGELPIPPKGQSVAYDVTEAIGDTPEVTYSLVVPGGISRLDVETPVVERDGGPSAADHEHRERLFRVIGRVTVAAGLVEAALKRVLICISSDRTHFPEVDLEWAKLELELATALDADGIDVLVAGRLRRLLEVAARQRLRELRNDVTHAQWWLVADAPGRMSRWPRRSDGCIVHFPLVKIEQLAARMEAYAAALNALVANTWPRAVFQPPARRLGSFGILDEAR